MKFAELTLGQQRILGELCNPRPALSIGRGRVLAKLADLSSAKSLQRRGLAKFIGPAPKPMLGAVWEPTDDGRELLGAAIASGTLT